MKLLLMNCIIFENWNKISDIVNTATVEKWSVGLSIYRIGARSKCIVGLNIDLSL